MRPAAGKSDVVIVGCGVAGLCAAAAAVDAGASVTMLERATLADRGGNTKWTEAYLRMKNVEEVSDDFEASLIDNGGFHPDPGIVEILSRPYEQWPAHVKAHALLDPELVTMFSAQAAPTLKWLAGFGVRFDALPIYHLTLSSPRIAAVGGGQAILDALFKHLESRGTKIVYETTAIQLLRDNRGVVIGVEAIDQERQRAEYCAKSTVLASGGFEGNPEMLTKYLGARAKYVRPVAPGGYYNKGEGIRMALEIGVAPAGEYSLFHAEPVDPRSRQAEAVVFVYSHGILINSAGERFVDEAPGYPDLHYENICHCIADQPNGMAYAIYDSSIEDVPNWRKTVRSDHVPYSAGSLAALAKLIAVDGEKLQQTVTSYNSACVSDKYSPLSLDGACTHGVNPKKSNWARALGKPPYSAFPVIPAIVFTFGGIKIDTQARAIDNDGRPVPGLYAAGELVGMYHRNYTGATSVLRGAVFGRAAGIAAARRAAAQ